MTRDELDRAPDDFGPGVLTAASGAQYLIGDPIGLAPGDEPCDAKNATVRTRPDGTTECRCVVCPRCHHHTGNSLQGHYWKTCASGGNEFHFCCEDPEFGCELAVSQ